MRDTLLAYFAGEKHAGLMVAGIGVCTLAAAAILYQPRWELRSFAITLGVFALAELALGVGLYAKTGPQVERLLALLSSDEGRFFADEGARMVRVQRNFVFLEYAWLALIGGAATVAVVQKGRFFVTGIALGVLVNVAVILAFDLIAERRGAVYLTALSARR